MNDATIDGAGEQLGKGEYAHGMVCAYFLPPDALLNHLQVSVRRGLSIGARDVFVFSLRCCRPKNRRRPLKELRLDKIASRPALSWHTCRYLLV